MIQFNKKIEGKIELTPISPQFLINKKIKGKIELTPISPQTRNPYNF